MSDARPEDVIPPCSTEEVESPFYIAETHAPNRNRQVLKNGNTFAIIDSHGDIGAASGRDGLFAHDTRRLAHLELLVNGMTPLLLHAAVGDDNISYHVDLTNGDIFSEGRLALPKDTLYISRSIYLTDDELRERLSVENFGTELTSTSLSLLFGCDFADIFEVRGMRRQRRGSHSIVVRQPDGVQLGYRGLAAVDRTTDIRFTPEPALLTRSAARFDFDIKPAQRVILHINISTGEHPEAKSAFTPGLLHVKRSRKMRSRNIASVETSNEVVNDILRRSASDLAMLTAVTEDGPYPHAGIPWYATIFGRDGIITAMELLWCDPQLAAGVLRHLARLQADRVDGAVDAEPGKIIHEMRSGEMAALREIPFGRYYGSVDATPLFVMLAGDYAARTNDWQMIHDLWPAIERALAWIEREGDPDGDGFVEYQRHQDTGLANQGWKDSHDSIFHADGNLAIGPIALVEVQAYVYAAKKAAAFCARTLGLHEKASAFDMSAEMLRAKFDEAFWDSDASFYALALDGEKRPCKVRTSNPGHALMTSILPAERAASLAHAFLRRDFFSGWGIRTVAENEARYNPMSYHNGSIWPHDNALIVAGLARYGHTQAACATLTGLMSATAYLDNRRIPELYCGFRRRPRRAPTLYPAACSPQAWSAAAPFSMIASILGLAIDPSQRTVSLCDPALPDFIDNLTIRNLHIGKARLDMHIARSKAGVAAEILHAEGDVRLTFASRPPIIR